jgi:hypothetical protein
LCVSAFNTNVSCLSNPCFFILLRFERLKLSQEKTVN